MSFGPSAYELVEFREKMKAGTVMFDHVVTNLHFFYFWNSADQQLLDYIIQQVDMVMKTALYIRDADHQVVSICKTILTLSRAKSYPIFIRSANLYKLFTEYLNKISNETKFSQDAYFDLLSVITNSSTKLIGALKSKEFVQSLVSNLDIDECYFFLSLLIVNGNENNFLKKIDFMDMVVDEISRNTKASNHAQNVILKGFEANFTSQIINSLMKENRLAQIIDNSIVSPDSDTLEFLRYITQEAGLHFASSYWKSAIHLVEMRLPEYIKIMLDREIFTNISESVVSLTIAVFYHSKKRTDDIDSIFYKLSSDFFKYKCNSFLHNSFLKLIECYNNTKTLTNQMLSTSHLFEMIISAFEKYDKLTCAYWGQLYKISKIINPYFTETDPEKIQGWTHVMQVVNQSNKIISASYGGHIPLALKMQKLGYDTVVSFTIVILFIIALIYILLPSSK